MNKIVFFVMILLFNSDAHASVDIEPGAGSRVLAPKENLPTGNSKLLEADRLRVLESTLSLDRPGLKNQGYTETQEAIYGAQTEYNRFEKILSALPKSKRSEELANAIKKMLLNRKGIYESIEKQFLTGIWQRPAVSFEDQLKSNKANIEKLQTAFLAEQQNLKLPKGVYGAVEKALNDILLRLQLQYENLLIARQPR